MRLSQIKLAGFKSFVEPAGLPLPSNLTAVVGPNGCGKSNLIDAVRWLLGETSMRELRSGSMEDVIFNGCKTRKPAGRAGVELIFDNSDGAIGGPYAAYNEISVRRELTRDGDSQYYLNGAKCLKRDVTDLFLGTGLAARTGYAIIEQGMVSRMIEAKPEELRQWLEEAAGISKYKERRRETETRIKQTRENLARLNDLRAELQARLEALRRQSKNAEKFKEYKERERKLRAELLALRLRELETQCGDSGAVIAELERAVKGAHAAAVQAQEARGAAEAENQRASHALSEEQERVYQAEAQLARVEQSLAHARELRDLKAQELGQLAHELEALSARESREQARLDELVAELEAAQTAAAAAAAVEEQAQAQITAAEEAAAAEQNRWEAFAQRAEPVLVQAEGERVRAQSLERLKQEADERAARLVAERAALDEAPIQASLFEADGELETLRNEASELQARLQAADRQLQELRDARAAAEGALHEARQALQAVRGRVASLETLQQAALRQDDAILTAWLRERGLDTLPRLAGALRVEPGWETAVEHVLETFLQAPLVPDFASRITQLEVGPRSGLALLAADGHPAPAAAGSLATKVEGGGALTALLNTVLVAETMADADQLNADLTPGESVITRDGVWRGRGWIRFPRAGEDQTGVIARGMMLRQLHEQEQAQAAAVAAHEHELSGLNGRIEGLESQRRESAERLSHARGRAAERLAQREAHAVRLHETQIRAQAVAVELEAVEQTRSQHAEELAAARARLAALEQEAARLREERAALSRALADSREAQQRARAELTQAQRQRNQAELQAVGRKSAVEALRQTLQDLEARRETIGRSRADREREAAALAAPLEDQGADIEQAKQRVHAAREALRAARERLAAAETSLSECVGRVRQAEFDQDAARERLQQARLEFQGLDVRRQTLSDQIAEAGFARESLLAELAQDATPQSWEEKLAQLTRRIERLGPINLAAIEELEEAQSREQYLGAQYQDLTGALETLEAAIRKIDAETKERFKLTFDRVDQIFRERFPRLFGGGESYLELTGDNLLETGVRVMARPPGKRNSTIQMLSGGEKAMVAVALLLALFELNPAPFCMLDEVDAPLDDANVARFCEVIREMSERVQFIIITHNKLTMELASHLHGVTMQEPGVSRLVSVNVNEAVQLAQEAEAA